nr:MAG TPA: hypothetical protein [Caudoviricetes sp.]
MTFSLLKSFYSHPLLSQKETSRMQKEIFIFSSFSLNS